MNFSYILNKIQNAEIFEHPFRHLEIDNLFNESDFKKIIASQEIAINQVENDEELFQALFK